MKCKCCNAYYTSQTLRNGVTIHRQQIQNPRIAQIQLSGFIEKCAKYKPSQLQVFPIYLPTKHRENIFIQKHKPRLSIL